MKLFDLSEKNKLVISFTLFTLIAIAGVLLVNNYSMKQISNQYMKQNMAIIGSVEKYNPELADKIIPIITKGTDENYENGQAILSKYSYDINNESVNSIVYNAKKANLLNFMLLFFFLFAILMIYVYIKFNKIYGGLKSLNKKAELIVEGKYISERVTNFNDGMLDNLNIQFSLMQNRIKASIDELKKEKLNLKNIINDISHQFKTPIAAMTMYTDILKDSREMEKDEIEYFLDMTSEQVGRMDWLVRTLLKYARLESNVVEYKKINQSVNETINECIEEFKVMANEKNIILVFINPSNDIVFSHDRKWIQEAIKNIIKNAIEHTQKNGNVTVNLEESEVFIRIIIKDNGEGIAPQEISKIFERFHKGSNSVNPQSIGIGLALSKNIIEGNNGSIKVKSEINKGSEFIITFIK